MFLLIPVLGSKTRHGRVFTFHNVSINTLRLQKIELLKSSLHSTMFLLIPSDNGTMKLAAKFFTFHNVSINTVPPEVVEQALHYFTFHNVSINTESEDEGISSILALHSTMFLLIPGSIQGA